MERSPCGRPTRDGGECQTLTLEDRACYRHDHPEEAPDAAADAPAREGPPRDLADAGWWVVEGVASDRLSPPRAQAITSALRVVASAPPKPIDEDRKLAIGQLWGKLFHGLPPSSPQEWELAAEVFDAPTMAELRRWEALFERDGLDAG